jgi:hypothetical protein
MQVHVAYAAAQIKPNTSAMQVTCCTCTLAVTHQSGGTTEYNLTLGCHGWGLQVMNPPRFWHG